MNMFILPHRQLSVGNCTLQNIWSSKPIT